MTERDVVSVGPVKSYATTHLLRCVTHSGPPVEPCDVSRSSISCSDLEVSIDGHVRRSVSSVVCGSNRRPNAHDVRHNTFLLYIRLIGFMTVALLWGCRLLSIELYYLLRGFSSRFVYQNSYGLFAGSMTSV